MEHLRRREWVRSWVSLAMLGVGLPLSLLGPIALASAIWAAGLLRFRGIPLSWPALFLPLALLTVPLLYRRAWREPTGERGPDDGAPEVYAPGRGRCLGPGGGMVTGVTLALNAGVLAAGVVNIFMAGPRAVVGAIRRRATARRLRSVDRSRAAEVVAFLAARGEGAASRDLLGDGETIEALIPVLAYLAHFQWISARDQWTHVWLSADARRALLA